jgi:prepilin-type N-terminal cleavage/methylation domain-containing protein
MRRAKRGFTLIEILVATAVAVLIMGAITSVFYYLLVIPPQQTDQLNAENQLRLSLDWIQRDGVQAHSFTRNTTPYPTDPPCEGSYRYGYFSSYTDPGCADADLGCSVLHVAYSYDDDNDRLIREESIDDGVPTYTTIAFNIADLCDVSFDCGEGITLCDGRNPITVNMTVTRNKDSQNNVRKEISITDTRKIEMRAAP